MSFFNTFRGKLLLILAVMLVATLGFQFYLNLLTQNENDRLREEQEQAFAAGISLGFSSLTRDSRMQDLLDQPGQTFLDEQSKRRIKDVIIINNDWEIEDSLQPAYLPDVSDTGESINKKLRDITDLPPLMEGNRLGDDLKNFPNGELTGGSSQDEEAHAIPIQTSAGKWYVMVVLRNDLSEAKWRHPWPLMYTLGVLLASSFITFFLVWRFTRPIANLAAAARAVAHGDLGVRVPDAARNDEMGRLASRFNEMTSELEKNRELEMQLQQAEKSAVVGRLGSAIAHEIRNPLNYINLTLDHLRAKYSPIEPERKQTFEKLTSQLKGEVARINQQITDFLNYSRPARADLKPWPARTVVEESIRIAEVEAADKNVTIGVIERENVPEVLCDPEILRSVFNNLFINAIQAMEGLDGGSITIKISADDGSSFVAYEIADTGKGISKEDISNIFEPYFSTKETGTGLGLAIVQKIVEIHNGTIDVGSEEGKGTCFTVRLPKAENVNAEALRQASEAATQMLEDI